MRALPVIAADIRDNWKKIDYAARPFVEAMEKLEMMEEFYGPEPGDHIARCFLATSNKWIGREAKRIKSELDVMVNGEAHYDRNLSEIAKEIQEDWINMHPWSVPIVKAMGQMGQMDDTFGDDPAVDLVNHFLTYSRTWRGLISKRIKKELREMVRRC